MARRRKNNAQLLTRTYADHLCFLTICGDKPS
jgi:hypothetical protein